MIKAGTPRSPFNPTNAVGGSFILSLQRAAARARRLPNPTNAVGGSFIASLRRTPRDFLPRIPPTQLVDRSNSACEGRRATSFPESHQRSWWIVHSQPTKGERFPHQLRWWDLPKATSRCPLRLSMNNPPTALVGFAERDKPLPHVG